MSSKKYDKPEKKGVLKKIVEKTFNKTNSDLKKEISDVIYELKKQKDLYKDSFLRLDELLKKAEKINKLYTDTTTVENLISSLKTDLSSVQKEIVSGKTSCNDIKNTIKESHKEAENIEKKYNEMSNACKKFENTLDDVLVKKLHSLDLKTTSLQENYENTKKHIAQFQSTDIYKLLSNIGNNGDKFMKEMLKYVVEHVDITYKNKMLRSEPRLVIKEEKTSKKQQSKGQEQYDDELVYELD